MPETPPPRRSRIVPLSATLAASGLLILGTAGPAAAVVVEPAYGTLVLAAQPEAVSVGDTVTVTASASALADAYAYDLDIAYDPALLSFVADSEVVPEGGFGTSTDDGDSVSAVATRLGTSPGLTGDHDLVTLTFTAIAAGDATFTLTAGEIVDSEGSTTAVDTESDTLSASITIAAREDEGAAGASGPGEGTGADGSTPTPVAEQTPSAGDGSLASTGTDSTVWMLVGAAALVAVAAGSVVVVRRKTR
ncbi:cohesin domain-containing protein [Microbacterium sp. ZW T5_45]|uniref:cohesin domain-containing protein n=1 Tax=Microbacterium sp. ZW T5_45 TaxID=3378080 RepID=UPI0038554914